MFNLLGEVFEYDMAKRQFLKNLRNSILLAGSGIADKSPTSACLKFKFEVFIRLKLNLTTIDMNSKKVHKRSRSSVGLQRNHTKSAQILLPQIYSCIHTYKFATANARISKVITHSAGMAKQSA